MELVPYQDIEKMGKAVAVSGLFGIKTEAQAIALMLVAQALGKHPALAAMEYNIIQGRPSKKADAMQVDFQSAGGKIEWHELTDTKAEATFSHPSGGSLKLSWDIDRAKKAGLYDKDGSMYKKYPRQMLRARLVADGVRAVYPAATGGMLSKEEAEDISELKEDPNKSRLDNIIDAQAEVKDDAKDNDNVKHTTKQETKTSSDVESTKNDVKKSTSKGKKETAQEASKASDSSILPEGHKIVIGLIDNTLQGDQGEVICYKTATVDRNGTPTLKHSFLIGEDPKGKRYGTFDATMAAQIVECIDKRIMVKFEYKERDTGKTILNDIVKFSKAVAGVDVDVE